MTAVILDDEKYCTDVLSILLEKYCPEVKIVGVFNNADDALQLIQTNPPELLFLDIEMPKLNGFDLLRKLDQIDFKVIFTTAYDQYALKAFKYNAIDYLLKPIDKDELIEAVRKGKEYTSFLKEKLEYIQYLKSNEVPDRIILPIGKELIFINVNQIICCEAEGSYCRIFCSGITKPYLLSKNLRDIEELLNNPKFFRPHASWLVNDDFIRKVIKSEGMEIVMQDEIFVPVARNKKQEVMARLVK